MVDIGYDHDNGNIWLTGTTNIEKPEFLKKDSLLKDIFFWKYSEIYDEFESVKKILNNNEINLNKTCYCLTYKVNSNRTMPLCGEGVPDEVKDIMIILYENEIEILNSHKMHAFASDAYYRIGLSYADKALS